MTAETQNHKIGCAITGTGAVMKWDKVRDFAAVGKVSGAYAFRASPLIDGASGWCLGFSSVSPDVPADAGPPELYTKRGQRRVFRTLDAVAAAVDELELGSLRVQLVDRS